MTNYINYN